MRLAEQGIGEIILVDVLEGLAKAKALDIKDSLAFLKYDCNLEGTSDFKTIKNSDIVIITAGLARKPEMSREELLLRNAKIVQEICGEIKNLCRASVVLVVSNPVDILTYLAIKEINFPVNKVIGVGANLDTARFINIVGEELKIPSADIDALVIGSHGESMLALSRLTTIKGVSLDEFIDDKKSQELKTRTVQRGAEIVSLLGSGSAYFAPSLAVAGIVKTIVKDEKRIVPVSAYLNGEYGIRDICIGVPCLLGRNGIERIITLDLNTVEIEAFIKSVDSIRKQKEIILKP